MVVRTAAVALLLAGVACSGGGNGGPAIDARDDDFDRRAMLEHLVEHHFVPAHEAFVPAAAALEDAIVASCESDLPAARLAWRAAIDAWEHTETVLVGPAAMDDNVLRDRIYAWPLVATCGIDREVTAYWAAPGSYDVSAELANVRSLAAVEYLLFNESTAHTCAAPPDGWDALGADLPRARCGLAAAIAADVAAGAALASDGWPAYAPSLIEGGAASENVVSDALFYVDTMVKDMKVGESAGIVVNACGTVEEPCLREVEHRHADHATSAIRTNLRALRAVFTGTTPTADGPSFDDHLRAVGAADVADRMTASLDAAIAAADALPESFLGALADDRAAVVALHTAIRAFTDDLKSEFLTILGLEIPDDVAADND